jgi:hypothetical protein
MADATEVIRCDFTYNGECAAKIPEACICGKELYKRMKKIAAERGLEKELHDKFAPKQE